MKGKMLRGTCGLKARDVIAARYRVLSARNRILTIYPGRRSPRHNALRSLCRVSLPWAGISRAVGPKGWEPISLHDFGDLSEQY